MTKKDRGGDVPRTRAPNAEAVPPLLHPGGSTSELGIWSVRGEVRGGAEVTSLSGSRRYLQLRIGLAAPEQSLRRDQRVPRPGPRSLVPSQEPIMCSGFLPPPSSGGPDRSPGRCWAGGPLSKGYHLAEGWYGAMLGDPDTHAEGHRPDRERRGGEELINQMLLIFF